MRDEVKDKRSAVLNATLELISEHGFHGTSMAQISKRSKVSIGTIYHYFTSKEDLINALYIDIKKRLSQYVLQGYSKDMPVRKAFKHIFRRIIRYSVENPQQLSFAEQYENSPLITSATREEGMRLNEPINELFKRAHEQELLKDLPFETLGVLINSAVIGLAKFYISGSFSLEEESLEAALDAIWDMIKR